MRIFVLGGPHKVGGAGGECLGAIQLWRKHGLDVHVIPTWEMPEKQYIKQLEDLGCVLHSANPRSLGSIEGLAGATVVCFCNDAALRAKHALGLLKCQLVFAPLMCFLQMAVRNAAQQGWINEWVFQSDYQMSVLCPQLKGMEYKDEHFHKVNGYIDWSKIPFKPLPHAKGSPFVMGRAARPRASKWHRDWWKMYGQVPNPQAIILGADEETFRQIGKSPKWAECHKPGTYPTEQFYPRLHATVTCNESDQENAPRITLESFAYGVAMVSENRFGYRDQIQHGVTGMMGDAPEGIGEKAKMLAEDEDLRITIVRNARKSLEEDLCNPDKIWEQWKKVLGVPEDVVYGVSPVQEVIESYRVIDSFFDACVSQCGIPVRQWNQQQTLFGQE